MGGIIGEDEGERRGGRNDLRSIDDITYMWYMGLEKYAKHRKETPKEPYSVELPFVEEFYYRWINLNPASIEDATLTRIKYAKKNQND